MKLRTLASSIVYIKGLCAAFLLFCLSISAAEQMTLDQFMETRGYAVVPMKHGYKNRFYADATVNGQKLKCLVDTGASFLVLDSRKAMAMKLVDKLKGPMQMAFGSVQREFQKVDIERLQLGTMVYTNFPAIIMDLHEDRKVRTGSYIPSATSYDEFDVVLGMEFLEKANAAIECQKPALYLRSTPLEGAEAHNLEVSLKGSGFSWLSFTRQWLCCVEGEVNGKKALFRVDTGTTSTTLDQALIRKYGLVDYRTGGQMVDAAQKRKELLFTKVQSIRLANFDTGPMPVGVSDFEDLRKKATELEKEGQPVMIGYLGPEILYRAGALIDCSAGRIYVRPAPAAQAAERK